MQKHPMLSVKEAAEALKIDERSVRDRLANGTLKGEKKLVGLREKWFIYSSAIASAVAKQESNGIGSFKSYTQDTEVTATPVSVLDEQEAIDATYGDLDDSPTTQATDNAARGDWRADSKSALESMVDTFMKPLVDKVAAQEREIADKQFLLLQQEATIKEQERRLRLLPDLEKERKEMELKELEMIALQKQMAAAAEEKARVLAAKETEVISLLKRAEEERITAEAAKQLADSRAAEIQGLTHKVASVEVEKQILETKAAEAVKLASDLESLKKTVEELKKPWWKKFRLLGDENSHI